MVVCESEIWNFLPLNLDIHECSECENAEGNGFEGGNP